MIYSLCSFFNISDDYTWERDSLSLEMETSIVTQHPANNKSIQSSAIITFNLSDVFSRANFHADKLFMILNCVALMKCSREHHNDK